jgi:hypothetical protein
LPLLISAFTNEVYRTADSEAFKDMNCEIVDAFISILRENPTEAEPFLHIIAEHIEVIFLQETQSRSDLLYFWTFEESQKFIREEGHTIPELRNTKELRPYMDGLPVDMPARDLAAASLLSLGGVAPPLVNIEDAHPSASLEAQGYTPTIYPSWFSY